MPKGPDRMAYDVNGIVCCRDFEIVDKARSIRNKLNFHVLQRIMP